MDKDFKTLCELFYADSYENDFIKIDGDLSGLDEMFQVVYKELGISLASKTNPMKNLLHHIYVHDKIAFLERMLNTGETIEAKTNFGFDSHTDIVLTEFEKGDWVEESSSSYEEEYGEEGYNYYEINTKNYIHTFSELQPHSEGLSLYGSDKKNS